MKDWKKYDKETIWADKKRGGLLVSFLKEYRDEFKVVVNASCSSCFNTYYSNYLKSLPMEETKKVKCDYRLKLKYENISLKYGGKRIKNADLTNELAIELLEKHPHGAMLFDVIPKVKISKKETEKKEKEVIKKRLSQKAKKQKKSEKK